MTDDEEEEEDNTPKWPQKGATTTDKSGNSYTMLDDGNNVKLNNVAAGVTSFTINEDGKVIIDSVEYTVKEIAATAFSGASNLDKVEFPASICARVDNKDSEIAAAVKGSKNPLSITITGSGEVPEEAFYNTTNIKAVAFGDTITSVGEHAFAHCSSLKSVDWGGVTTINEGAFTNCGFEYLEISDNVKTIGEKAFSCCTNLSTIYLPRSVTIQKHAFFSCPAGTAEGKVCYAGTAKEWVELTKRSDPEAWGDDPWPTPVYETGAPSSSQTPETKQPEAVPSFLLSLQEFF